MILHPLRRQLRCVSMVCSLAVTLIVGCREGSADIETPVVENGDNDNILAAAPLDIYWPPRDPSRETENADEPLLHGELGVAGHPGGDGDELRIQLTLRRSEGEEARIRWNDQLAFPEYAWMSAVRVWDVDKTWLWPNLPYLLRAHGEERVERYGGVDPGKGIDNDFAAVLIRPLELQVGEEGQRELVLTPEPLVSAEWYPVDVENPGRREIVHRARSDEFIVRLPSSGSVEAQSGRLGVWLVYADFLDSRVPRSWPEEGEYDGGILAYLDVVWKRATDGGVEVAIHHMVPPEGTGFDWVSWSTGPSALEKNLELAQPNGYSQ